jgi:hypothetical protein
MFWLHTGINFIKKIYMLFTCHHQIQCVCLSVRACMCASVCVCTCACACVCVCFVCLLFLFCMSFSVVVGWGLIIYFFGLVWFLRCFLCVFYIEILRVVRFFYDCKIATPKTFYWYKCCIHSYKHNIMYTVVHIQIHIK